MTSCDAERSNDRIDIEAALKIVSTNGPLSAVLEGFECRKEQKLMMSNVIMAYNRSHIALIEAGTGTGKSLAYLIPAMLWAVQTKERSIISTNTITLQQQLLEKDIPLIDRALNLNVKAVIVKGMHNYLCIRKLEDALQEILLLSPQEADELQKIDAWNLGPHDGSRSSLPFNPSSLVWEKVSAESDTCNRNSCPYYQQCHFFKARRQANDAQILIVNHHLLFSDLALRAENDNFKDVGILPNYSRIIIDEAHNIEDIATDYFASRVSQMDIMRLMARLTSEKGGKQTGKLPLLREKLTINYRNDLSREVLSLHNRLSIDLPGMRRDLIQRSHEMFSAFSQFTQLLQGQGRASMEEQIQGESKLRILPSHQTHLHWQEKLVPDAKSLIDIILRYVQSLSALEMDIKHLRNTQLDDQVKGVLFEINALASRLNSFCAMIEKFIGDTIPSAKVRWIELQALRTMTNTTLVDADLDISKILANFLFSKFATVVLCSATLTTNQHFQFIRSRLGLNLESLKNRTIKEYVYQSPFNFAEQALLGIPTDLPNPNDASFVQAASEKIWKILQCSRGNAFVLFTSYSTLKSCYDLLESKLLLHKFNPLRQGVEDRQSLLKKFKTIDRSVLFGTDSFWEGVDVVGEALRCVIIVKLPFRVPSDPLIQARSEAIISRGGDPFMEYSLPQAIVKFKQGFGRLIRNRNDRGCIVCLDNRLMTKRYGSLFISSLPACQQLFASSDILHRQMAEFYRRTYFLTKKAEHSQLSRNSQK